MNLGFWIIELSMLEPGWSCYKITLCSNLRDLESQHGFPTKWLLVLETVVRHWPGQDLQCQFPKHLLQCLGSHPILTSSKTVILYLCIGFKASHSVVEIGTGCAISSHSECWRVMSLPYLATCTATGASFAVSNHQLPSNSRTVSWCPRPWPGPPVFNFFGAILASIFPKNKIVFGAFHLFFCCLCVLWNCITKSIQKWCWLMDQLFLWLCFSCFVDPSRRLPWIGIRHGLRATVFWGVKSVSNPSLSQVLVGKPMQLVFVVRVGNPLVVMFARCVLENLLSKEKIGGFLHCAIIFPCYWTNWGRWSWMRSRRWESSTISRRQGTRHSS